VSFERVVRIAALPEMRLAYFEREVPEDPVGDYFATFDALWDEFNAWRVKTRPALGRIDIAALALTIPGPGDTVTIRTAVPIRGDYTPVSPAKATIFPGGTFVYCYADNLDEIGAAQGAVTVFIAEQGYEILSGPIEAFKFHYNLDQHPADCGYLVKREGEPDHAATSGPLPIAR
jgi:hypothetical protein